MRDNSEKFDWQVAGKAILAFIYLGFVFIYSYLNSYDDSDRAGFFIVLLLFGIIFLAVPLALTAITILIVNKINKYRVEKAANLNNNESKYIFKINFRILATVITVLLLIFIISDESNPLTVVITEVLFLLMSLSVAILYSFLIFKKNKPIRTLGSLMYIWCVGNVFYMFTTFLFLLNR